MAITISDETIKKISVKIEEAISIADEDEKEFLEYSKNGLKSFIKYLNNEELSSEEVKSAIVFSTMIAMCGSAIMSEISDMYPEANEYIETLFNIDKDEGA